MDKKWGLLLPVIIAIFCSAVCHAESGMSIEKINLAVAAIDDSIRQQEYPFLLIEEQSEAEGNPPVITLHFRRDSLIAAIVTVGHETWLKEFRYYYYPNGKPMKYLENIKDRADNPAKKALIYSEEGSVIWKNTGEEIVKPTDVQEAFTALQHMRKSFNKY